MSTRTPQTSIIIATYNRAEFIERTVRSALAQTVADLEVIVYDDASTDDSVRMISSIQDGRLHLHRQPVNVGIWQNWNGALEQARGEWVVFLGDDDYLAPDFIERLLGVLRTCPDAQVVFAELHLVGPDQNLLENIPPPAQTGAGLTGDQLVDGLLGNRVFFGSALFKRSAAARLWSQCMPDGIVADWGLILRMSFAPGTIGTCCHGACYFKTVHGRQAGVTIGPEVLRQLAVTCARIAHEHPGPRVRRRLRRRAAFEWISLARHHAATGAMHRCREHLGQAVRTDPTLLATWTQLIQSWIMPRRFHASARGTISGPMGQTA